MVRTGLKLSLLAALVVTAHLLALEWIGRQADAISGLPAMAPTMYTRLLKPAPPPVVAAASPPPAPRPKPHVAPRPKPKASAPKPPPPPPPPDPEPEVQAQEPPPEAAPELAQAEPPQPPVVQNEPPQPEAAAEAAAPAASEPATATAAAQPASAAASAPQLASLDSWPTDTRLTYQLGGEWRSGPLFGHADVQWQREGDKYQVRLDVKIRVFGTQVLTSQGEVTPGGLLPRAYEELRPGKRRAAQFGEQVLVLENGKTAPRPPGVQDTASQFVELSHRFATGRDKLEVGRSVEVWLARPGGLDLWTYDIVERETLRTPRMGAVEAFHLKPREIPNPRGNITAEMWFAPSLQYLPVRIKVIMGGEAYLDLLVDQIEQR